MHDIRRDAQAETDQGGGWSRSGAFLALSCIGLIASPALAQESTPEESSPRRLGGVTVTDTAIDESYNRTESSNVRMTQPILDTPRSISVIPEEMIRDRGFTSLTDVLRATPGITLGGGEGGTPLGDRPFIRGYEASTDMQINGIRNVGRITYEVFNLDSTEVLYGPAGSIAGRGSTGGAINLILKQPREGDSFSASFTGGTDETKRVVVDGNKQLGDMVAFRVAGMFHDSDVAGRDHVWSRRYGIMPSLTLGLGQPLRVNLTYSYLKTDGIGDRGQPFSNGDLDGRPLVLDRTFYFGLPERDFARTTSEFISPTVEYDLSDRITIRNSARWSRATNDAFFSRPSFPTYVDPTTPGLSATARNNAIAQNNAAAAFGCTLANLGGDPTRWCVNIGGNGQSRKITGFINQLDMRGKFDTGSAEHSFIVGLEYSEEAIQSMPVMQAQNTGPAPIPPATLLMFAGAPDNNMRYRPLARQVLAPGARLNRSEMENKAAYLTDSIALTPQLILDLGIRYDAFTVRNINGASGAVRSAKYDFVNYAAGIVYKPVPNTSIYLNHGTSSNPPGECDGQTGGAEGANACSLNANNEGTEPERAKSWELGVKWDSPGGNLSLTAALFQTRKNNARANDPDSDLVLNIGSNRVRGFQLGATGNITPEWSIFAGYMFLDTKTLKAGEDTQNEGNAIRFQARHTGNLWTTYQLTPQFNIGLGANYVGKRYVDSTETLYMPGYWRFDASIGYAVSDNIDLRLNVLNATDKTYFDTSHVGIYAVPAPGRSALLTANMHF